VFPLFTQGHTAFEHMIKNNGFNALDKCAKPLHPKLLVFIEIYHSRLGSHSYTPTLFQQ
jgi:hypothetical protein